jgi:hypothetical protein
MAYLASWDDRMSKILSLLVECTDHRVVSILQVLRPLRVRRSPGPSHWHQWHGMVGAMTRDRASSINVVAISRSSTHGGLNRLNRLISQAADVLLYFEQSEMLAVRKRRLIQWYRVVRCRMVPPSVQQQVTQSRSSEESTCDEHSDHRPRRMDAYDSGM